MDTGKNKMVGMRKKRALRGTIFGDSGRGISGYFRQYGQ